ncbi:uncharacterized protein TNCV_2357561 [Trichonephila clavipes]|nr:uncharacterized protein TNCV_2357561 [Trichonephila clavipes]
MTQGFTVWNVIMLERWASLGQITEYPRFPHLARWWSSPTSALDTQSPNILQCGSRLSAVPHGLGSNPGEGTDVCKCILPSRHEGTLNSRRAASPLVKLVEGEEMWEAPDHLQGVLPQNWGGTERKPHCHLQGAQSQG